MFKKVLIVVLVVMIVTFGVKVVDKAIDVFDCLNTICLDIEEDMDWDIISMTNMDYNRDHGTFIATFDYYDYNTNEYCVDGQVEFSCT